MLIVGVYLSQKPAMCPTSAENNKYSKMKPAASAPRLPHFCSVASAHEFVHVKKKEVGPYKAGFYLSNHGFKKNI